MKKNEKKKNEKKKMKKKNSIEVIRSNLDLLFIRLFFEIML